MTDETALETKGVDVIHDLIRAEILSGQMPPDSEISQVSLARRLGVSRTPLREALRMLMREGLVTGEPNQAMRVAGFSIPDMEQLYVERIPLEAIAIRRTVELSSAEDLAAMAGLLSQMEFFVASDDYTRWEVPHRALHEAFTARSGERLGALLTQLYEHASRYRQIYARHAPEGWRKGRNMHVPIVEACQGRRPDEAALLLAEHLGNTALSIIAAVEPDYRPELLEISIAVASQPLAGIGPPPSDKVSS